MEIKNIENLYNLEDTVGLLVDKANFNFGDTINIPSISYDANGHIASTTTVGAKLPILAIEADTTSSNGMVLTKVNNSGTKLTNKSLVEITLNGYTGQTNLFDSSATLGGALNKISDSISNLQTSIKSLQTSVEDLKTRVSALERAAK